MATHMFRRPGINWLGVLVCLCVLMGESTFALDFDTATALTVATQPTSLPVISVSDGIPVTVAVTYGLGAPIITSASFITPTSTSTITRTSTSGAETPTAENSSKKSGVSRTTLTAILVPFVVALVGGFIVTYLLRRRTKEKRRQSRRRRNHGSDTAPGHVNKQAEAVVNSEKNTPVRPTRPLPTVPSRPHRWWNRFGDWNRDSAYAKFDGRQPKPTLSDKWCRLRGFFKFTSKAETRDLSLTQGNLDAMLAGYDHDEWHDVRRQITQRQIAGRTGRGIGAGSIAPDNMTRGETQTERTSRVAPTLSVPTEVEMPWQAV